MRCRFLVWLLVMLTPVGPVWGQTIRHQFKVDIVNADADALTVGGGIVAGTGAVQIVSAAGEVQDGALSSNVPLLTLANIFTVTQTISNGNVQQRFAETGVTANNGRWLWQADGEQFLGVLSNDAWSSVASWLVVDRADNVVDSIDFPDGPIGIGDASGHRIGSTGTSADVGLGFFGTLNPGFIGIDIQHTLVGSNPNNLFGLFVRPNLTEPASGTNPAVTALSVEPTWTAGAGSFNTTRTIFVNRPSTLGTAANYGFYVDGDGGDVHVLGDAGGLWLIGDTASTDHATGIVIRYSDEVDPVLVSLKNDDTAHAIPGLETDTIYQLGTTEFTNGGVTEQTYTASATLASYRMHGHVPSGWAATGKATGAPAIIQFHAYENNTTPDATDENLFGVYSGNVAQLLLDQVGLYLNGTSNASAFDEFEDVYLARALDLETATRGLVRTHADRAVPYTRTDLIAARIISDEGFINVTAHAKLLNGAIWQLYQALQETSARVAALEAGMAGAQRANDEED